MRLIAIMQSQPTDPLPGTPAAGGVPSAGRLPRALLLGLALVPQTVPAAPPAGQLLASQCFQCHGTDGQAVSGFESIAGKSAEDMYKGLLEMSQRPPENIMDRQARIFTPAQLRLIANYLATLPAATVETLED
jgi:sulfide dehydrogenase cytochrome subunit